MVKIIQYNAYIAIILNKNLWRMHRKSTRRSITLHEIKLKLHLACILTIQNLVISESMPISEGNLSKGRVSLKSRLVHGSALKTVKGIIYS